MDKLVNQKSHSKRILVNTLSAQLGGGQTYLLNLFHPSLKIWDDCELIFLTSDSNDEVFRNVFGSTYCIGKKGNGFLSRTIWENFFFSSLVRDLKTDLVFLPGGTAPVLNELTVPMVSVSQNMLPFDWNQIAQSSHFQKIRLTLLRFLQLHTFRHSRKVIFLSRFARDKIQGLLGSALPSAVIPHGVNEAFFNLHPPTEFRAPYFLYVSTFFEYKHQLEVLRAFESFVGQTHSEAKLLFVGNDQSSYGEKVHQAAQASPHKDRVVFLGNVPYGKIPAFMQHSDLNIFASDCENCPNILLEYLASGQPVLSSSAEPMPEFGEGLVEFFHPADPAALTELMKKAHANKVSAVSKDLIRQKFSWDKAARETKEVFQKALCE